MQCIQQELGQLGIQSDLPYKVDNNEPITDSSRENTCPTRWPPTRVQFPNGKMGWMDGLLGCIRPFYSFINKTSVDIKNKQTEEWEIPFEAISDLQWIGSGAQGAVFSGKYKNEIVAVKKVRDVKETDIKNLRKLDHENIIKFK